MDTIYSTFRFTQATTSWLLKPISSCVSDRVKKTVQSLFSSSCYSVPEKIELYSYKLFTITSTAMPILGFLATASTILASGPIQGVPSALKYISYYFIDRTFLSKGEKNYYTLRLREKQTNHLENLRFIDQKSDRDILLQVFDDLKELEWFKKWMSEQNLASAENCLEYWVKDLEKGLCLGITTVTRQFLAEKNPRLSLAEYLSDHRKEIFQAQIVDLISCDLNQFARDKSNILRPMEDQMLALFAKPKLLMHFSEQIDTIRTIYEKLRDEVDSTFDFSDQAEAMQDLDKNIKETLETTTKKPLFPASILSPSTSGDVRLSKSKVPNICNHIFSFYTTKEHITLCDSISSKVGIIQYPKKEIRLEELLKKHIQHYYSDEYDSVRVRIWGNDVPKASDEIEEMYVC